MKSIFAMSIDKINICIFSFSFIHFNIFRTKLWPSRLYTHFLGRTLSDDDVKRIVEHCQVDKMRNNDKVNLSYWGNFRHVNDNSDGGFINKGIDIL